MEEQIISASVPLPPHLLKRTTSVKAWFGRTWKDIHMISDAHITLYLAKYPKTQQGFDKFVGDLHAQNLVAPHIIFSGVKTIKNKIDDDWFFFLGIERTKELYELHKAILKLAQPHQKGLIRKKDMERLAAGRFSKQEGRYLKLHGYARILQFFNPHITLGEVANMNAEQRNKILATLRQELGDAQKSRFAPAYLVVGLYGYERGKYTKLIREDRVKLAKR